MKKARVICLTMMVFSLIALALTPQAIAAYPEKPIEFVIHSAPGGGMDRFTRTVAHILETKGIVDQKIRVTNRRGGGATVAINYVMDKKGDPYVLQHWTTSPLSTLLRGTTKAKSWKDLTIIGTLIEDPNLAAGLTDTPFNDMADLITYAKANPHKIRVGINTIGGSEHIIFHRIMKATGAKLTVTSFGNAGVALLGGHIDMFIGTPNETVAHTEGDKMKILATTTLKRIPFLKDIPTMLELGIDASFTQYRGFWGGPGFPAYAVKFWEGAFKKLMETKEWQEYMTKNAMVPTYNNSKDAIALLGPYYDNLGKDIEELKAYKK